MSNLVWPPPTPDLFGQILTAGHVREALIDTIQLWSSTYIAELAATTGLALAPFGAWASTYDIRALPADQQAACWATCTTTDPRRPPERQGNGYYSAVWVARANIVVYGQDWDETADLISAYMAAVRASILQHRSLGGFATDTRWMGEATKQLEQQSRRTVETGIVQFAVTVDGMVTDSTSPPLPSSPPGVQGNPTVDQVTVTVAKDPIT